MCAIVYPLTVHKIRNFSQIIVKSVQSGIDTGVKNVFLRRHYSALDRVYCIENPSARLWNLSALHRFSSYTESALDKVHVPEILLAVIY